MLRFCRNVGKPRDWSRAACVWRLWRMLGVAGQVADSTSACCCTVPRPAVWRIAIFAQDALGQRAHPRVGRVAARTRFPSGSPVTRSLSSPSTRIAESFSAEGDFILAQALFLATRMPSHGLGRHHCAADDLAYGYRLARGAGSLGQGQHRILVSDGAAISFGETMAL